MVKVIQQAFEVWILIVHKNTGSIHTDYAAVIYHCLNLVVGKASWMILQRSAVGMRGHYRSFGELHGIPESGVIKMRNIDYDTQIICLL
ncbi:unnamed protein product, partial [marine sediment metagenome]